MDSQKQSNTPLKVEITGISSHGVSIVLNGRELFMAYTNFPWFREQPVKNLLNVEEPTPGHFHWPDIDVDLSIEMIEHPERYPNISRL